MGFIKFDAKRNASAKHKGATSVVISSSIKSIGDFAFSRHTELKNIIIPKNITHIGKEAFYCCTNLESIVFECPNGWYYTNNYYNWQNKTCGTLLGLSDPLLNAKYFKLTYRDCYWYHLDE